MKISNKKILNEISTEKRRLLFYIVGAGAMASLATLVIGYFFVTAGLNKAQANLHSCQNLLANDNFFEAEQECEQAREFLSSVKLMGQGKKEQLNREVHDLLASQKLQQGLLGNIMVDGEYVSQPTKILILAFKKAKINGDIFFEKKNWLEAEINYQRAKEVAAKTTAIDQFLLAEVRKNISTARFNILLQNGDKALVVSDREEALIYFNEALMLAKKDSNILSEDMVELTQLIDRIEFESLSDKGHEFFNKGDWNSALRSYAKALKIGSKLYSSQSEITTGLQEDIARTKLYMNINNGKKAFTDTKWGDAISHYEKAIAILRQHNGILGVIETQESSEKLSRILLQCTIVRDREKVAKDIESAKYAAALDKLRAIQTAIANSPSGDLPEFQTVMQDVSQQIDEVTKQFLIAKSISYLTRNYQQLFLQRYPEITLPELKSPKIRYLSEIGNKLLFRMQSTENNRGRPIRLEIDYLYSPDTDDWQLYSEE